MKLNPYLRKFAPAALAALSLLALPTRVLADDDHDKKEHPGEKHKVAHEDRVEHKDKVAHVDRADHKIAHEDRVDHKVAHEDRVDHRVHDPALPPRDRVVAHHDEHVAFHRHSGYALTWGDGYRGRGYYYGPPGIRFFAEGPDVVFYANRGAVPVELASSGSAENADSEGAAVQTQLAQRGFYHGEIDGDIGPASGRAIQQYQQQNNLAVTGTITPDLLKSLGVD